MTSQERERLQKRREALKQDLSTLRQVIMDTAQLSARGARPDQLARLRALQAERERELDDVEAQLAKLT